MTTDEFKIENNTPNLEGSADKGTQLYLSKEISKLKDSMIGNFITILGIFASFLAFLIIEIQILKTVCDYLRIMGFSLFILGAIFCFITFLLYFIDSNGKKIWHIVILTTLSVILIGSGVLTISRGEDEYICKLNRLDNDFQTLQQSLRKENTEWLKQKNIEFEKLKPTVK